MPNLESDSAVVGLQFSIEFSLIFCSNSVSFFVVFNYLFPTNFFFFLCCKLSVWRQSNAIFFLPLCGGQRHIVSVLSNSVISKEKETRISVQHYYIATRHSHSTHRGRAWSENCQIYNFFFGWLCVEKLNATYIETRESLFFRPVCTKSVKRRSDRKSSRRKLVGIFVVDCGGSGYLDSVRNLVEISRESSNQPVDRE